MALTHCKECNQEVSTEAKTCPHCGIDYPGSLEENHRLAGVIVVLGLIMILAIYVVSRGEKTGSQNTENTRSGVNQDTHPATAKIDQAAADAATTSPEAPLPTALLKPQPPSIETTQQIQADQTPDQSGTIEPAADTPQALVMRMLNFALDDGGMNHESDIQQTKQLIESFPRPSAGNKKAAKTINAKALVLAKKGDFSEAVKQFAEANRLDPSDIEIANNLGFSYLKQGDLDSAQPALLIALTLSPGRASAWENLAEVFGFKGDENKAAACFSNAYRFSKDPLKMRQFMKKQNEKEPVAALKQARDKALIWAEKAYPAGSKK